MSPGLQSYREQVLRWNRQINLVSRRDSAECLEALIQQARNGLDLVRRRLDPAAGLLYCDLGSGGGIPGVIWHLGLCADGPAPESWLVEPRQKRAWFLDRVARELGSDPFAVAAARWGADALPVASAPKQILISLKALRLTDAEVLAGLAAVLARQVTAPRSLLIARFYPPDVTWSAGLAADLAIPEAGTPAPPPFRQLVAAGGEALTAGSDADHPAGLVLSSYRVPNP